MLDHIIDLYGYSQSRSGLKVYCLVWNFFISTGGIWAVKLGCIRISCEKRHNNMARVHWEEHIGLAELIQKLEDTCFFSRLLFVLLLFQYGAAV